MSLRRLLPGLLLGFLVLLALILVSDLRQVSAQMLAFRWQLYPLVLLFTLFNYGLRFVKWHFYLAQIGINLDALTLRESARLFFAGFPLAVTPGKAGEALKGYWLNQKTGIPTARGISVVLAERISDGLAVLLLSTLGVIAYPRYWLAFAFVLAALLTVILISQIRPLALALLGIGEKLPIISRFSHSLREFYEGSFALFRPKTMLTAVSLGTVAWLGEGIGLYFILLGLGVPASWQAFSLAVFILAFSTVIGAASALPGGLGAAEASISGMLIVLLNLSTETAAAATLLIRFATLWFAVAIGLVVWAFSRDLLQLQEPTTPHANR
ncbi:MAG: lysylphosphatidylglycerol synthase transmembrane domain-containing protein [Anaerolineales bacterium]